MTNHEVEEALRSIYEEIMWLSNRPNVTPSRARAWYTHIMAESTKRRIRRFTGFVSRSAINLRDAPLRLEHYQRIQTTLTALVARHNEQSIVDPAEFTRLVLESEQVHIVTVAENYEAMKAEGDYRRAGIKLVPWAEIKRSRRRELWTRMLRGKVSNALDFPHE